MNDLPGRSGSNDMGNAQLQKWCEKLDRATDYLPTYLVPYYMVFILKLSVDDSSGW